MIAINKNILALKPSATLEINQKVKELKNKGKTIFHLGFGQSPFSVHKSIVKKLRKYATVNTYLPTLGLPELIHQISVFLKEHQGITDTNRAVYIGPGSKELLYQTILLLEGVCLIPKGSWVSYGPQIQAKGSRFKILSTDFENDFKLKATDLDAFCKMDTSKQKTLILNSPNNPTGAVYTEQELKEIAAICKKYGVIVLSDEIYSQLNFNANYSPSICTYYPEKTIVFGGLSKVFSAGGYRLGFMSLPKEFNYLETSFKALFSETFSCVSSPIQYAAIKAFKFDIKLQLYVEQQSEILKNIAAFVKTELELAQIRCTKTQGGFYMMIGFKKHKKQLKKLGFLTSKQLADYLLDTYRVALLPASDFYFNKDEFWFRLAFVDFNGKKMLKNNSQLNFDKSFVKKNCPNVFYGVEKLKEFAFTL